MVQELNKIAIIHLFILGFEEEIGNFTLSLTNPSTQADLMRIDVWKEKVLLFKDMVADPGSGIAPVSQSWAKKHILGFSDDEIKLDLQQQRIERAVGEELKKTAEVITHSGIFDNIDRLYGKKEGEPAGTPTEGGAPPAGGESGGAEPSLPAPPPPGPEPGGEAGVTPEQYERDMNILLENNFTEDDELIDLSKAKKSLVEIEDKLKSLLKD